MATVLDLFCGAGGFSLGFDRAGHDVLAGVDNDEHAVETYRVNHDARGIQQDLTEMSPTVFSFEYGIAPSEVDGIVGGPPCQGFTIANVDRRVDDERNNLVFVFAEYVDYYEPDVFFMENVKGIQQSEMEDLFKRLLSDFRSSGYNVGWRILNATSFGVPQDRERVFVQGRLDGEPTWPTPTAKRESRTEVVARGD